MEEEILPSAISDPKVVYGYFPAQSDGNDIIVYEPDSWTDGRPPSGEDVGSRLPGVDSGGNGFSRAPQDVQNAVALAPEATHRELLRFPFPRQREGRKLA